MKFCSFEQVIEFFDSFTNLERKTDNYNKRTYRVDRMSYILNIFENPQNSYKTIHVAGSKGKGSTATLIAKGLEALGFKTALYMSPHLIDYRERFTLCGKFFDDSLLIKAANILYEGLQKVTLENEPTTFELYTIFAFILFKEANCEWAVIETGLGGRLDATNVLYPEASVLTPIELEHTEILGNTITEIAIEKSKIIKKNRPCIISKQTKDAKEVFKKEAESQNSDSYFVDDLIKIETSLDKKEKKQFVKLSFNDGTTSELRLNLLGQVQAENSATALLTLKTLGLYKEGITERGLEKASLPGRMEKVLINEKELYLDGAHTPHSLSNLLSTFSQISPSSKNVAIFCCVKGKDYSSLTRLIQNEFKFIIVSKPGEFKKSEPQVIYDLLNTNKSSDQQIYLELDSDKALRLALELCDKDSSILATGSFYLAGKIKESICRLTIGK